jgi:cob(I)alamin adenosyltransferase
MVAGLEARIDGATAGLSLERGFAVPGDNRCSAALDVARAVVRRAERLAARLEGCPPDALAYLNRLSDLCWALARAAEDDHLVQRRLGPPTAAEAVPGANVPREGAIVHDVAAGEAAGPDATVEEPT